MEEVLLAANSADATVIAMILPFLNIVVIELAYFTKILSHVNPAVQTNLSNRLLGITDQANYRFDILPAQLVPIFGMFIVAMAAVEDFIAAGCADLAPPPIVLASVANLSIAQTRIVSRCLHL